MIILWFTYFDDWFKLYGPCIKRMRNPAPRKNAVIFCKRALSKMAANAEFEPEQLESSISTPFLLSQPLGLWYWHECGAKIPFRLNYQRWRHQHLEKVNFWTRAPTMTYNCTFSTRTTTRSPVLTLFLRFCIILTLPFRWLTYAGVMHSNKTTYMCHNLCFYLK